MSSALLTLKASLTRLLRQSPEHSSDALVIAYSGGVDSTVLLHCVKQIAQDLDLPPLFAFHVNHGLNKNAMLWQSHCATFCQTLNVPFASATVEVKPRPRQSLEAEARDQRYAALMAFCQEKNAALLLGQHEDDQLETLLLQLKRGAGPKGLSGMAESHWRDNVLLLRPMLNISQSEIHKYATDNNLNWVEDDSNKDTRFDRNFLRQQILPVLQQRWPQFATTASRSARLCQEQSFLLQEVITERLATLRTTTGALDVTRLNQFSYHWQKQLLRTWLEESGLKLPSSAVLDQIVNMLTANQDRQPLVQLDQYQIRRFQGNLKIVTPLLPAPETEVIVNENTPLSLSWWPVTFELTGSGGCTLIAGLPSIIIRPEGSDVSKPLKTWLKSWHVPPWERKNVPILFKESQPVAVILKDTVKMLYSSPKGIVVKLY
ncbi:tRNA lysidine(34) synthetase TilS [Alteromonas pelagimontana]|uniref:tRNA(Ile)-lysidine synthase n=1 Tax=Alteromonas pelagimontana TaxID=1858656 RepID=A0A6M4MFN5_9ALTE|nr:tRNA lysidine(34) synthetase TilS [Alteromonas pelagimontana]QJR81787.1 tRNA lysidine(34) synthetase TilS [Alteromonas pelagimontana]